MESEIKTLLSRNAVPIIDLENSIEDVAKNLERLYLKKAWKYFDGFVELTDEVKLTFERSKAPDAENHGYVSPGMERFDGRTPELRHAYNICKLQDQFLPEHHLPGFSRHINSLVDDFNELGRFILKALAISLSAPPSFFTDKHSYMLSDDRFNLTTLRMLFYPPVEDQDHGRSFIRCGAHADYCSFTLLAQDSEGGLEVKLRGSDKWERVGHLPGALFINCGETMAIWTDQFYHALQHRVVVPDQVDVRHRGRHSIAYFCHPDNSALIDPNDLDITTKQTTSDV
ncbi:GD18450 [Drosophila simulans]|uniref:GD18450 n=1 Tax=Drosophila simulans TaxID=7240 RepID=B4R0L8_DROSI|nr:GD18450 [Drosophila simulans]